MEDQAGVQLLFVVGCGACSPCVDTVNLTRP